MKSGENQTKESKHARAVLDALRRIVQALRMFDRAAEKQAGLSGAQLFVLARLAAEPSLSLNELAERTHTHQSSVSVVVHRLVEQKLVRSSRSREDARRLELTVSAAGRALLRKAPPTAQEHFVTALSKLGKKDQGELVRLLERLVKEAGLDQEIAPMLFEDGHEEHRAHRSSVSHSVSPFGAEARHRSRPSPRKRVMKRPG